MGEHALLGVALRVDGEADVMQLMPLALIERLVRVAETGGGRWLLCATCSMLRDAKKVPDGRCPKCGNQLPQPLLKPTDNPILGS